MAEKRKDSRGIVLQQGESQNSAGRYRYRYFDDVGLSHDVYAWRLRPEDPVPEGKKPGASLRELELQIQKDRLDNVKSWGANISVNRLLEEYMESIFWRGLDAESVNYWDLLGMIWISRRKSSISIINYHTYK